MLVIKRIGEPVVVEDWHPQGVGVAVTEGEALPLPLPPPPPPTIEVPVGKLVEELPSL